MKDGGDIERDKSVKGAEQPGEEAERRFFADDPALDPYDLSGLRPKFRPRRAALAAAVILACAYLIFDFRHELRYLFSGAPDDVGDLSEAFAGPGEVFAELRAAAEMRREPRYQAVAEALSSLLAGNRLETNSYVKATGVPNYPPFIWVWENSVGLGRGPGAGQHARLVTFPAAEGQPGGILHKGETVELTYLPVAVIYYESNNYPREQLRGGYEGRLVRAGDAPFLAPILEFLRDKYKLHIPPEAYVLLDGETPAGNWIYGLVGALALLAIAVNLVILARQLALRRRAAGS
jgi:hypothetical protein